MKKTLAMLILMMPILMPLEANAASTGCFPAKLRAAINKLESRIGPIHITSGYRRGRRGFHPKCMAADFRPTRVPSNVALAVLRTIPEVGGIGTYRGKRGLLHMDVREGKMRWHH